MKRPYLETSEHYQERLKYNTSLFEAVFWLAQRAGQHDYGATPATPRTEAADPEWPQANSLREPQRQLQLLPDEQIANGYLPQAGKFWFNPDAAGLIIEHLNFQENDQIALLKTHLHMPEYRHVGFTALQERSLSQPPSDLPDARRHIFFDSPRLAYRPGNALFVGSVLAIHHRYAHHL